MRERLAQRAKQPRLWQYALVGGGADVRLAGEGLILRGLCGCFVFGAFDVFRRGGRLRSERRVIRICDGGDESAQRRGVVLRVVGVSGAYCPLCAAGLVFVLSVRCLFFLRWAPVSVVGLDVLVGIELCVDFDSRDR